MGAINFIYLNILSFFPHMSGSSTGDSLIYLRTGVKLNNWCCSLVYHVRVRNISFVGTTDFKPSVRPLVDITYLYKRTGLIKPLLVLVLY